MEELLHKAIESGDETKVRNLIIKGASMDKLMGLRGTALCAAIADRQTAIAFYLIKAGCDVNGEDYDGEPPLLLAMRKECFDIVRKLIKHPNCKLNKPDPLTKLTPLCFASKFGQKQILELLVSAGCKLDGKDADDNSALHLAIDSGHGEVVEYLIRKGCNLTAFNKEGLTPVHILARKGDHNIFTKLLSKWTKIKEEIPNKFERLQVSKNISLDIEEIVQLKTKYTKETPLLISARHGHSYLIKMFLICGADPNANFYEMDSDGEPNFIRSTPLMRLCSCYKNRLVELDTVRWLLDAGCDVNMKCLEGGQRTDPLTPLAFCARHDLIELAKLFVEYGADVNLRSNQNSPLYEAILHNSENIIWYFLKECQRIDYSGASGFVNRSYLHAAARLPENKINDIVEKLVLNGSDINLADDSAETPLMLGIEKQNVPFVRKLLALGANVDMRNKTWNTPLHLCVDEGSVVLTKLLLSHGADVNAENLNKSTPFDVALEYLEDDDYKEIAVLLLQNGSRVSSSAVLLVNQREESFTRLSLVEDDQSDEDEESDNCSSSSSLDTNENWDDILRDLLLKRLNNPLSLSMIAVSTIRCHFRANILPVDNISNLPLPKSIIDLILLT